VAPSQEFDWLLRVVRDGGGAAAVVLVVVLFLRALQAIVKTFGDHIAAQQQAQDTTLKESVGVLQSLDGSVRAMNASVGSLTAHLEDHTRTLRSLQEDQSALLDGRGCRAHEALERALKSCPFATECAGGPNDPR
jgi:peptidoglycan hydrolase CwlO-like protein